MAALAKRKAFSGMATSFCPPPHPGYPPRPEHTTEQYDRLYDNEFLRVSDKPLSTFSIDVDAASYANVRRFLDDDRLPPRDAVRIEELINYFTYDYPEPAGDDPFSITTEMAVCPWHPDHHLVHIGLQGRRIDTESLPPSNLVFLLDVSGSMHSPDKLPLLKSAMTMLVNNLRPVDNVAIVVYAGAAGLVLPTTPGDRRGRILGAIERLSAGGSTAGGAGIRLAYATARDQFIDGGNNRVILATDGDFNVGVSSEGELVRMIEEEREHGVFLTVLGFGTGNYKDATMEKLADKGNGNYAYIDNVLEARKVLVSEMGGTLVTIAKDVKIQVEFNPATVGEYRLIGYVNRRLEDRDFNDDTKDAGELGAGHTVTALYEVVPVGVETAVTGKVDALKYQTSSVRRDAAVSGEVLTVKFRYKKPDGNSSMLITRTLRNRLERRPSTAFRFSAAVAGFGMLLRESRHAGKLGWRQVYEMARESRGEDRNGYRAELMRLTEKAAILAAGRRAGASAYPVGE
jgi:Ca-activated chloride channel family protein